MIASTRYRVFVPTELVANLKFRRSLIADCRTSSRARRLTWIACTEDPVFFINAFCWQTNPENIDEEDGPFICFPFQEEAIDKTIYWLLHERRRLVLWEKSRKQGGTMLLVYLNYWLTNFHKRKRALMMSHSEAAVEKSSDEDTLFGKIDFTIHHIPSWMQGGLPRNKGIYVFKRTNLRKGRSQIRGISTTIRSGVGPRVTLVSGDEASKWNNADLILGTLKETGPILAVGTHYGIGGTWYDLCKRPDACKIVMHWSKNPMYNRGLYYSSPTMEAHERVVDRTNPPPSDYPFVTDGSPHGGPYPGLRSIYYDELCRDRSAREMAIHWDINPSGAARQFFNVNMIREYIHRYARPPEWEGEIDYDPSGRFKGLRTRENGPLRLWCKFLPHVTASDSGTLYSPNGKFISPSLYKVGGDIGQGTGATPSCLAGGDALTGQKILEYQYALPPQAEPTNFAKIAVAVCNMLGDPAGNPSQIVWDTTGPSGGKFSQAIVDLGFRNFWYWRDEFKLNQRITDTPGWFANNNSTMALFRDYNEALDQGWVFNPSENALKETLAFEYIAGGNGIAHGESLRTEDPSAGRINHSDMAYADALMVKLMREAGLTKKPEDRLEQNKHGDYGWNDDGPTFGWLLQQGNDKRKDPFRR